jgi:A/G-specific adenine glycosylase
LSRLFASRLIGGYLRNHRDLPWRRTQDPYRIWVSEIMLQQTRAQTVVRYFERFVARFPTVESLARASESEVLACWSGLGYYSRARNMLAASRQIVVAGGFPRDYDGIRALPGIGPYTAASIASIAFDLPHGVLDGNVMRVIARLRDDPADIASARTRSRFQAIVQQLLDRRRPGLFNQAMMELGATVCLPRHPACGSCPVARHCQARERGTAGQLPVKLKRTTPSRIEQEVALVRRNGRVLMWQRGPDSARMAGFWELPQPEQVPGLERHEMVGAFRHTITHHVYEIAVISGKVRKKAAGLQWIRLSEIPDLPVSTIARKALEFAVR